MFMIITLLTMFSLPSCNAASTGAATNRTLANFTPGKYDLKSGTAAQCGAGEMSLWNDGLGVTLSVFHGFDTVKGRRTFNADADDEKDCIYDSSSEVEVKGKSTVLTTNTTLRCPPNSQTRHVATETAIITASRVDYTYNKVGAEGVDPNGSDASMSYKCSWEKKKK